MLRFATASLICTLMGCATAPIIDDDGGSNPPPTEGGPVEGGSKDSGSPCPTGKTGPNCSQCAKGFHSCGANSCQPDNSNSPDAGCTNGCNGPCAQPTNSTAACTPQGSCDFTCNSTFVKDDAGCSCDVGMVDCMNGTCAQCCSNSDCPQHVTCNGGTCGGCETNWGDCNNNMGDGCESTLSAEPNCGTCGTSCPGYPACGVLTFHGKSCKSSGQSYSCQC
jgi:hypothetical protein